MTVLCIFAHPDDETVACAGTIAQLAKAGHSVIVVSATSGSTGQVSSVVQTELKQKYQGDIGALRKEEFERACQFLGADTALTLGFIDGQITNQQVWGELSVKIIELIETHQPELLITFDHSGWYYHLDHVAVSIATTLAFHQTEAPKVLLFSNFQPKQSRWRYVFPDPTQSTHAVEVRDVEQKLQALSLHRSQDLSVVVEHVKRHQPHQEYYQLAFERSKKTTMLKHLPLFVTQ